MKEKERIEVERMYHTARETLISLVDTNFSPDHSRRISTLSSNTLATVLADHALLHHSEKTTRWIQKNAQGMDIVGIPSILSESSSFMAAIFAVLEKVCGFSLPPLVGERIPPVKDIVKLLVFPYSSNTSYLLPLHLACVALSFSMKGTKADHIVKMISDLQQPDGSWTDDVIITALCALALHQAGIEPMYNVTKWLKEEQLPDGSWAACNGEVWEASYALKTGEVPHEKLVSVLEKSVHPNYWWGFSRYAVPDTDDTAAACCALQPYNPHLTDAALKNLVKVQNEDGGWSTFPDITGVVPRESVEENTKLKSNDITCHVLEALWRSNQKDEPFKRGISHLLEAQDKNGYWKTTWWRSDIYGTAEIASLMNQNKYTEPASHALAWLEKKLTQHLNTVEYALLIKAFSEHPEYSDSLDKAVTSFIEHCRSGPLAPTFDSVYFAGLIDLKVHRLSLIVDSLHTLLKKENV
ncbi:MAG: hypothetical protein HXS48_04160 [Theionarchaea archaeon]|nr:MAG: hypothetical protein AYK19_02285 [Theionarchaea archaeon DG-70-1]MBU7026115.1 hypothetical protein [Theionarchaea archaeon]